MQRWLAGTLGAIAGTVVGVAVAAAIAWWLFVGFDTSRAPSGQQDSYAMAMGFAIMGLGAMGAAAGCIVGIVVGLVLHRRKYRLRREK
jgi:membrane associated rhomboid family serine protease